MFKPRPHVCRSQIPGRWAAHQRLEGSSQPCRGCRADGSGSVFRTAIPRRQALRIQDTELPGLLVGTSPAPTVRDWGARGAPERGGAALLRAAPDVYQEFGSGLRAANRLGRTPSAHGIRTGHVHLEPVLPVAPPCRSWQTRSGRRRRSCVSPPAPCRRSTCCAGTSPSVGPLTVIQNRTEKV